MRLANKLRETCSTSPAQCISNSLRLSTMPRISRVSNERKRVQRLTQKKQDARPCPPNQTGILERQSPSIVHRAATARPKVTYRDSSTQTIGRYRAVKPAVVYASSAVQTTVPAETVLLNPQATASVLDTTDTIPENNLESVSSLTKTRSSPISTTTKAPSTPSLGGFSTSSESAPSPEPDTLKLVLEDSLCTAELRAWERGIASAPGPEEQHRYAMMLKAEIQERGIAGMNTEMLESVMQNYS